MRASITIRQDHDDELAHLSERFHAIFVQYVGLDLCNLIKCSEILQFFTGTRQSVG